MIPCFANQRSSDKCILPEPKLKMERNGEVAGRSLDILLKGYAGILGRGSDPLTENAEYMQLIELHFLVKKYGCSHVLCILMHYVIHQHLFFYIVFES